MKVAAIQHDIEWENAEENHERHEPMVRTAATAGARFVALTEMFATGFSMATDRTSQPVGGSSTRFLQGLARELGIWICGSIAERPDGAEMPSNTLVLAGPGEELHRYRKIHPFSFSGEHESFSAGSDFLTVEIDGLRITPFVCYDLRFADEFWGLAPTTDVYVVVANWPAARAAHWRALLVARAIENQAWVVACNRVGEGGGVDYDGGSVIVDPWGDVVTDAGDADTTISWDVDPGEVARIRGRYPFLADRRAP